MSDDALPQSPDVLADKLPIEVLLVAVCQRLDSLIAIMDRDLAMREKFAQLAMQQAQKQQGRILMPK